jgi:hypothetical protein
MLHIMQEAQWYSPAFVIQYNEVSIGAVDSCAALPKGSKLKCGIHLSTLQQAAKIWLFYYIILVNMFIIAKARFWKCVYLCTVYIGCLA